MNISLLYSICGLLVILIIYKQRKCWYFIWQLNGWRGLLQQPVLWLLLVINLEPKSIMNSIQRCHKYFQFPLAIIVFNRILLYVDDPVTMESILTAPECLNKTFLQNGFYANKGLLHAKDEQWKIRRKQLNPAFSYNTLVSFLEVFNRTAKELKTKIFEHSQDCQIKFKSLEDLITRAVLQVSCLTTMGYEANFLQHDGKCIAQAYRFLMELTALRILRPWYQIDFIFRLLDEKNYNKSKNANKLVNEFVANIVQHKQIEWQQKCRLHQKPDVTSTASDDRTTATNRTTLEISLIENEENHNFTTNTTTAAGSDALKSMVKEISSLPDTNTTANIDLNPFMPKQLQQQEKRIFIDQIFHLAQTGKLTLQDIMNESQSMVVVSFETVSTCIINALLCLAINHECQMKLRHEIQQVLLLSKAKMKAKTKIVTPTTTKTTTASVKRNNDPTRKTTTNITETCANTICDDLAYETTANEDCKGDENNSFTSGYNATDALDGGDVNVTMEDLLNMPYLDMIINESLRLLTTVPMNLRNVSADFQLNVIKHDKCVGNMKNHDGKNNYSCVVVPRDTIIVMDTFNMQRNEKYWGRNALQFDPEHFSKSNQRKHGQDDGIQSARIKLESPSRHSYAFIPFSKGLRTCIGYRYSLYLSKIILITLISSFEVSTNIELQDLQFYEGVSLKFRNADKMCFQIHPLG